MKQVMCRWISVLFSSGGFFGWNVFQWHFIYVRVQWDTVLKNVPPGGLLSAPSFRPLGFSKLHCYSSAASYPEAKVNKKLYFIDWACSGLIFRGRYIRFHANMHMRNNKWSPKSFRRWLSSNCHITFTFCCHYMMQIIFLGTIAQ